MAIEEIKIATVLEDQGSKKTLRDLQQSVKSYKSELVNLDRGTKEYNQTLNELAQVQGKINQINQDVSASTINLTDYYSSLVSVIGGVVGGFTAVQSAAVLLGADSDKLAETFVRLQASMALIQSITALSGAIKSARIAVIAFNTALASNPLVALAVAVVAVTAVFSFFVSSISDTTSGVDELKKSQEEYISSLEKSNEEQEINIRKLQAQGKSQKELIQSNKEFTKNMVSDTQVRIEAIQAEIKALESRTSWYNFGNKKRLKELKAQSAELTQIVEDGLKKIEKLNVDYEIEQIKEDKANSDRRIKEAKDRNDRLIAEEQARNAKLLAEQTKYEELQKKLNQELAENINAVEQAQIERLITLENLAAREQDLISAIGFEIEVNKQQQESLRAIISDPEASIEARINATKELQQTMIEGWQLSDELGRAQEQADKERIKKQIQDEEDAADELKKIENEKIRQRQATFKSLEDVTSATSSLLGESTAAGKALGIASATISTYTGAAQVLANPLELNPFAKWAQFAATIAIGLSAVKNILSTDIPGASESGSVAQSLPSMPELSAPIQETHNNMSAYDEEVLNSAQKVYVTENDISKTQSKVVVAESEASY